MYIPRNLYQTTSQDIEALVRDMVPEGPHLDFKRDLPSPGEQGRHDLVADTSAFANSGGGDIVYGIEEDGERRAKRICVLTGNADQETRRVQDILMNGIEPHIPGLQVHPVDIDGGFILVVRSPQSWVAPHRVKTNQHFFVRENFRKRQLDVPEIKEIFLRSENQIQRLRDFRTDRIGKVISRETPYQLVPGPSMVVHLIPTQAALGLVQIDPLLYLQGRTVPTLGTRISSTRLNFDGALGIRNPTAGRTHGYSQIFRNGYFEAVRVLNSQLPSGRMNLPSSAYEKEIMDLIRLFRKELNHLGIGQELACMFSIVDADLVALGLDTLRFLTLDGSQGLFDRKTLLLPDILLSEDDPLEIALRPLFDHVWQSAGLERSYNYDEQGRWSAV